MPLGGALAGLARVVLEVDDRGFHRDIARDQATWRTSIGSMERDTEKLTRGALAGSGAMRGFGRSIAFASGAFLGGVGFAAVVRHAVGLASELGAQIRRTNAIFGSNAREVQAWSKTTANSIALSRSESLAAANTFGTMLQGFRVAPARIAPMSKAMVELAGDMAKLRGVSPKEALDALTSGLRGYGLKLKEYGIDISNAALKQEALRLGLLKGAVDEGKVAEARQRLAIATAKYSFELKKYGDGTTQAASASLAMQKAQDALDKAQAGSTQQLDSRTKLLAAYAILMGRAGAIHEQAAKQTGSLAFQERRLRAELKNVEEDIGQAVTPVLLHYVTQLADWLSHAQNVEKIQHAVNEAIKDAQQVFRVLTSVATPLIRALARVSDIMGGVANTTKALLAVWAVNRVRRFTGELITGWTNAGRAAVYNAKLSQGESRAMAATYTSSMGTMEAATIGLSDTIKAALISSGIGALMVAAGLATEYIITHWAKVKRWLTLFGIWLEEQGLKWYRFVVDPFSHLPGRFGAWARRAKDNVDAQLQQLRDDAGAIGSQTGEYWASGFSKGVDKAMKKAGWYQGPNGVWYPKLGTPHGLTPAQIQAQMHGGPPTSGLPSGGRGAGAASIATQAAMMPGAGGVGFHLPGEAAPYDCSAFVQAVYARAGIRIGRDTYTQVKQGRHVDRGQLQPGDLIFMNFPGERSPGHVGIYVGGGYMVHDHGAHGGVQRERVPWGAVVDTRTYVRHGGKRISPSPDTQPPATTPPPPTGLHVGVLPKRTREKEELPAAIEEALLRARATRGREDDIRALDRAIAWVEDQLKRQGLSHKKRIELLKLLDQLERERDRDVKAIIGHIKAHKPGAAFTALFRAIQLLFTSAQGGTVTVTEKGTPFGTISIQVPGDQPQTIADWQALESKIAAAAKQLQARLKKENKRLSKLLAALHRALARRNQNPAIVKKLAQEVADSKARVKELKREYAALRGDYIACEEAIAALKHEEKTSTELPDWLRLELAEAELTPDTADDRKALQDEEAWLEEQLKRTDLTVDQRIAFIQELASVMQQLGETGSDADTQAQLAQLQAQLAAAQEAARLQAAFIATGVFGGGGGSVASYDAQMNAPAAGQGGGQDQGGGGGAAANIFIQSLFPPPAQWLREAAAAVAQGVSMQPYRARSVVSTGF